MPATNVQKTPFAQTIANAMGRRAKSTLQQLGQVLPCSVTKVSGSIVTVKFEVSQSPLTMPPATMPVMGPEYIRYPIQVGCKGIAVAADAFIGSMSGLGTGVASLNRQPNLSTLVFMPVGNVGFPAVDGQLLVMYGPHGVVIKDADGNSSIEVNTNGTITLHGAHFKFNTLPTSPGASGELWRDAGASNVVKAVP